VLQAAAARAPQLVVLDDLHAADPSSLLLLHFLVRDLRASPLMVVGTYREAEARLLPEVGKTLAQVAREACVLPLRRLDPREVSDFVTHATGAEPSAERVEAIHRRTEGNPLFLRELLRLEGAAERKPEGIREVVRARLSLLTPAVRRTLEAAAVLGRELDLDALVAIADAPLFDVNGQLALAEDAGIVEPLEQAGRFRFTHGLLREGLYDDLSPDRRAALHRAAAKSLARRDGEPLTELAHHLLRALPAVTVAEAADAALRAAERAMSLLAFEDAAALSVRAVELLEVAAGEERRLFEATLVLGSARIHAADLALGKASCLRAADLARGLHDGERFARAVLGCAYEYTPGVRDVALIGLLHEALAMLPDGDSALRARCMAQLAAERQPEPDARPPIELARAAVAMARRVGDADTLRFTLSMAGLAMLMFADPEERRAVSQEALRLALAVGDKMAAMRAHLCLATDCWELGDRAGADAHVRSYRALSDEFRHSRFRWTSLVLDLPSTLSEGRFDEAERSLRAAEPAMLEDESRGASMAAGPLGFCRAAERYEDLPALEARLRSTFGSLGHALSSCIGEMFIAELHARAGDRQRTEAQLAAVRAHPSFGEIQEATWLALLAEPCHLLGERELAERLYAALLPRAHRFLNLGYLGPSCEPPYSQRLGLLAQTLGRLDDAVAHLSDAESRMVQVGMKPHLARVRCELASVLLARAGAGDRERAAVLLKAAHSLAQELGQAALLPRISALVSEAGAVQPVARTRAPQEPAPSAPLLRLEREGDYYAIRYGARTLRLRDSRGLQVLAELLSCPGQELHVLQLVGADDDAGDRGDAGSVLDAEAVQRYRHRLLELREELEEAEGFADAARAERARGEIDFLSQELARAVGLGGRERRVGGAAERARTTVQKRLRGAIKRIEEELPELGRHLDQSVKTGTFCGYLPEGRSHGRR
jgi:hypothetical protein